MDNMYGFGSASYSFDADSSMMDITDASFTDNSQANKESMYLIKDLPPSAPMTGSTNLLAHFGLESTHNKFCNKKVKESLSAFLPDVPGVSDIPGSADGSSLRMLIEKPPIVGNKEIQRLSSGVLTAAFRLHPVPLPEQYRPLYLQNDTRRRHKQHKSKNRPDPSVHDSRMIEMEEIKKHRKRKHDDSERKKRKREKRKRKEREKEKFS